MSHCRIPSSSIPVEIMCHRIACCILLSFSGELFFWCHEFRLDLNTFCLLLIISSTDIQHPKLYSNLVMCLDGRSWCLVWRSGNGVGYINKVKLRRSQLVLGLVMTFSVSAILVFIQAHSAWPSVEACSVALIVSDFQPPLGKKQWVVRSSSGPCYLDCWYIGLLCASFIGYYPRQLIDVWMTWYLSTSPFTAFHCPVRDISVYWAISTARVTSLNTYGRCRAFAVAGPSTWNSLPDPVCHPNATELLSGACWKHFCSRGTNASST